MGGRVNSPFKIKFQRVLKRVSRMFQGYFLEVASVSLVCFKGVSRKFQECFKEDSKVFQGSFKSVLRKFQVNIKVV